MPAQHIVFPYPDGGLNETYPEHLIDDRQFSNLENFFYDKGGKLVSRPGTEFIKRLYGFPWGTGTMPSFGSAVSIQIGSDLYGRSGYAYPDYSWNVVKSGVISGPRFFTVMDLNFYSGCSDGSSTADNLKWDVTTTAAVTWPGSPPALGFVTIWNFRVWGIHRNNRTKVYFSTLGNAEDWTTAGVSGAGFIDVGYDDNDHIISLVAHNEQLFILKRRSIWHIVTGNPNTDTSLWRVELLTNDFGCTAANGVRAIGNDIFFPSDFGIISLNTALYQGDFRATTISTPIFYNNSGDMGRVRSTGQYLYLVSTDSGGRIYALDKNGQSIRWTKLLIRHPFYAAAHIQVEDTQEAPVRDIAADYPPLTTYGNWSNGNPALIVTTGFSSTLGVFTDLLQYPSTHQGEQGHYDYIDGPEGAIPIVKKFRTKMHMFGNLGYSKRSRFYVFSYYQNDRTELIENNTFKLSAIFDSNDSNKVQETIVNDTSTEVVDERSADIRRIFNRTPLRTAVVGIGSANGQIYKGIQFELLSTVPGHQLEYAGIEMDVEQIGNNPQPTDKVLT